MRIHIASLLRFDGSSVSSHEGKATLLLDSYKERLGKSEPTSNGFNMEALLANLVDLLLSLMNLSLLRKLMMSSMISLITSLLVQIGLMQNS
jgi:hypothetical protein